VSFFISRSVDRPRRGICWDKGLGRFRIARFGSMWPLSPSEVLSFHSRRLVMAARADDREMRDPCREAQRRLEGPPGFYRRRQGRRSQGRGLGRHRDREAPQGRADGWRDRRGPCARRLRQRWRRGRLGAGDGASGAQADMRTHPALRVVDGMGDSAGLRSGNSELLGRLKDSRRHAADEGNGRALETVWKRRPSGKCHRLGNAVLLNSKTSASQYRVTGRYSETLGFGHSRAKGC
jgi:hypothetical protein